jgi:cytidine deaminase
MTSKRDGLTELIEAADEARRFARARYSNYRVGAAIQAKDGRIFTGVNVESSSYGLTVCAERVALLKALSEGADDFVRIAIITDSDPPASPCGACRQLLWDYAKGLDVILVGKKKEPVTTTLAALYPRAFGGKDL